MNRIDPIRNAAKTERTALAPVEDYLAELHARVSAITGGSPADYIPTSTYTSK